MFSQQFELKENCSNAEEKNQEVKYNGNPIALAPVRVDGDEEQAANFYYWRDIFPELQVVFENIKVIQDEAKLIPKVRHATICVSNLY